MRTTVALEPDIAAEVERLRHARSLGVSAAINVLIRRGLARDVSQKTFVQTVSPMSARMDVGNIAEVLETLDGPSGR